MSDGEGVRIAGGDDPERRIMAEQKGRKRDGDTERFQVPRRHRDDEPLAFASPHFVKSICDRRNMPIMSIILAWCDDAESTVDERFQVLALKSIEQMPPQMRRPLCDWRRNEPI